MSCTEADTLGKLNETVYNIQSINIPNVKKMHENSISKIYLSPTKPSKSTISQKIYIFALYTYW